MERGAGSALFAGFRALGLFSTDVAHVLRFSALKRRFFVTTCVGKSFHTYDVSGLPRRPLPGTPRPRAVQARPSPLPPTCPGSACPPRLLPLPWVSPSLLHALGQPFLLPGSAPPPPLGQPILLPGSGPPLPLPWVSPPPPLPGVSPSPHPRTPRPVSPPPFLVLPARPRRAVGPRGNPAGTPGSVTSRLFPHTCEGVLKVYM